MTIATSQRDATEYEKNTLHAMRLALKDNSIEVGSWAIGSKNQLAVDGGVVVLQLAEAIGYDYDIRSSVMNVYKDLAEYSSNQQGPSQATQLLRRAEARLLDQAMQIRQMLNQGLL